MNEQDRHAFMPGLPELLHHGCDSYNSKFRAEQEVSGSSQLPLDCVLPRAICSVGWNSTQLFFSLVALTTDVPIDVCLLEPSKGKPVTVVLHTLGILKGRHMTWAS